MLYKGTSEEVRARLALERRRQSAAQGLGSVLSSNIGLHRPPATSSLPPHLDLTFPSWSSRLRQVQRSPLRTCLLPSSIPPFQQKFVPVVVVLKLPRCGSASRLRTESGNNRSPHLLEIQYRCCVRTAYQHAKTISPTQKENPTVIFPLGFFVLISEPPQQAADLDLVQASKPACLKRRHTAIVSSTYMYALGYVWVWCLVGPTERFIT